MEMAGKPFSLFMEQLVQLRLTACATVSYSLCNCDRRQFLDELTNTVSING
jgi:hypothetical protein